jgi:hypothetical protein
MEAGEDPKWKWHVQEGNGAAETWHPLPQERAREQFCLYQSPKTQD